MGKSFDDLVNLIRLLRSPEGCPWDREQTLNSLRPYIIEEAHELAAAISDGKVECIAEEVGDLGLELAYVIEIGREKGWWQESSEIWEKVYNKIVERHPHVFGDKKVDNAKEVEKIWGYNKVQRKKDIFDGISKSMPSLTAALRISQKAAAVGFDWERIEDIFAKINEELVEVKEAYSENTKENIVAEMGDLLFAVVNLARHLKVDPEEALYLANKRFVERFQKLTSEVEKEGKKLTELTLSEMDQIWERVKNSG